VRTIEDIRARTHGGRGQTLPSEKLNQLSECEQSEYKRAEIGTPIRTPYAPHIHPNPAPFCIVLANVLKARIGREF
jgi:hypothetical protein